MNKIILLSLVLGLMTSFLSCQTDEDISICEAIPQSDCVCTEEYEPVCGCDDETYGNACEAACNGIYSYVPGPCQ